MLAALGGCVLDLDGLSGGDASGSSGGGGGGSSATGTGGGAPAVLDCEPCPDGGCAPVTLASGAYAQGAAGIAIDETGLYWVNRDGGDVMRLGGSSATPELLAHATHPITIAAAGGFVAWAEEDGVWGCPEGDCEAHEERIVASLVPGSARGVALDGQYAYLADRGGGDDTGVVLRCPRGPCDSPVALGTGENRPEEVLLFGSEAFWTEEATGFMNGNVRRSPKGGQGGTQVSAALTLPHAVAVTDAYVYWTEASEGGRILRCPNDHMYCQSPESAADAAGPLATPLEIAIWGGRVYWTQAGDGAIRSCPLPGCDAGAPVTHASGRPGLRGLAVNATCVFWTDDEGGGSVSKVGR